jgi:AAA ATPase domain
MNVLAPAPAASDRASLEAFCTRLRLVNPFLGNRVNDPTADDGDVPEVHAAAFGRLTELAREAYEQRRGLGAVLWGEAGIGKSHVLARLHRWSAQDRHACCVYFHNLSASPDNLPRSILKTVVGVLTHGRLVQLYRTPLYDLAFAGLSEALGHDARVVHPWAEAEFAWNRLIDGLGVASPGRTALLDRTVYDVLFRFAHAAHRERRGKSDPAGALAVRWLAGDPLDADEARQLGLPPARQPGEPYALADNQQIKQVLVALAQLALWSRQPFVLCFDQVDNLDVEQAAALARFLEALLDSAPNLLVVTAGIQSTLVGWREAGVIQASAWDRLAQFPLALQRVPAADGRKLVARRLERFLEPFVAVPEVKGWLLEDDLFPLGRGWAEEFLKDRVEVRPREVITAAGEAWQREREHLRQVGPARWAAEWGTRQQRLTPPRTLEEMLDRAVADRVAAVQAGCRPDNLPPSAERLAEVLCQLLEGWRRTDPAAGLAGIEYPPLGPNRRRTYDAVLRLRTGPDGAEVRVGLVCIVTDSANRAATVLRRLVEDENRPERMWVITDARSPLPLGSRGEEYRTRLQERGQPGYRERAVSFPEHAALHALQAVVALARAGDLEVEWPAGQARRVSEDEVHASLHRQGRYREAPVLRELLA